MDISVSLSGSISLSCRHQERLCVLFCKKKNGNIVLSVIKNLKEAVGALAAIGKLYNFVSEKGRLTTNR